MKKAILVLSITCTGPALTQTQAQVNYTPVVIGFGQSNEVGWKNVSELSATYIGNTTSYIRYNPASSSTPFETVESYRQGATTGWDNQRAGMEYSLLYSLQNYVQRPCYMIKSAYGATGLVGAGNDWNPNGGQKWGYLMANISDGLAKMVAAGLNPVIVGAKMYQGEKDAQNSVSPVAYEYALNTLITTFRQQAFKSYFIKDSLPFFVCRISSNWANRPSDGNVDPAYINNVRTAQEKVASGDDRSIYLVDTDDIPYDPADPIHKTMAGQSQLGIRVYNQIVAKALTATTPPASVITISGLKPIVQ